MTTYTDRSTRKIRASPELLQRWTVAHSAAVRELERAADPKLAPLVKYLQQQATILTDLLRTQDEFNRSVFAAADGFPRPHAPTHRGAGDSIAGLDGAVVEIDFNQTTSRGNPSEGYAPIDHVHGLSDALEGLEGLAGTTVETRDGSDVTYVRDPELLGLLSEILLVLTSLYWTRDDDRQD